MDVAKTKMDVAKTKMDVAKTKHGEWLVVELGDAQVSELPEDADLDGIFGKLKEAIQS